MRPRTLDEVVGQEHVLGPGQRPAHRDRAGAPALDGPVRAAGLGQDDDRADRRDRRARGVRGAQRRRGRPRRGARGARARRRTGARAPASRRSSSSTRSTASTRPSRTRCCPAVEEGLVTLIGATTENPYFEVNSALLSRTQVYELRALDAAPTSRCCCGARSTAASAARTSVRRRRRRVPRRRAPAATRARRWRRSSWRARPRPTASRSRSSAPRTRCSAARSRYDKRGDRHYDTISAWIKATRGSDPDASLYYLAVMLEGGEDPRFIARRMVILASEDVGNADPQALQVAVAAAARRRARRACPRRAHALAQCRHLPVPGAEVQRRRRARSARARAHVREHGAKPPPVLPAERRLPGRGGARARPGLRLAARPPRRTSPARSCCPRAVGARASTRRARPRRSSPSAWPRSGAARGRGRGRPPVTTADVLTLGDVAVAEARRARAHLIAAPRYPPAAPSDRAAPRPQPPQAHRSADVGVRLP